ncbi:class I SAM-dependent methyltransferase [Halomicroarcula sp. GCM10025324]|uniref:class I SAM-dependent methyltransferase n=1 Tax=Haloarcula TaxID=2237 RepID=UPI0036246493
MDHARVRYLEAKRTVDDRALNRRVRERLLEALPPDPEIVEFAAGTGVTVPRLLEWGVTHGRYWGVDQDADLVAYAGRQRAADLRDAGYAVTRTGDGFRVGSDDALSVSFTAGDALACERTGADLVVAQAFADLVSLEDLLDALERTLAPGSVAYLPITFDGGTLFQPDHPADDRVERAYHDSIAARPGRDPRAGRHLLDRFRTADGRLLAAGASDWVVRPVDGGYPADERYFLECILDFVADALADRPVDGVGDWLETRREQLAAGELTYVAHQYDLLYAV